MLTSRATGRLELEIGSVPVIKAPFFCTGHQVLVVLQSGTVTNDSSSNSSDRSASSSSPRAGFRFVTTKSSSTLAIMRAVATFVLPKWPAVWYAMHRRTLSFTWSVRFHSIGQSTSNSATLQESGREREREREARTHTHQNQQE